MAGGLIFIGTALGLVTGVLAGIMSGSFLIGLAFYSGAGVLSILAVAALIALRPEEDDRAPVAVPAE